jgi:high-affinity nickel permease
MIGRLNDNADSLGFLIIGVFVSIWIGAIVLYRYKRLDEVEVAAD